MIHTTAILLVIPEYEVNLHTKQRQFIVLLTELQRNVPSRLLNDLVREVKLTEADSTNRSGMRAQLRLLIDKWGIHTASKRITRLREDREKINELVETFKKKNRLSDLSQEIYRRKMAEADALIVGNIASQIKFLATGNNGFKGLLALLKQRS